jgi:hypothetical protein
VDGGFFELLEAKHLYRADEVRVRPCPVPPEPGVYAWFFRELPDSRITRERLHHAHDLPLLYVGISPKRPPSHGGQASRQNLRKRIQYHYRGNAAGSTLRCTLGCLLAVRLGLELRRVGSGGRLTFSLGEAQLTQWMAENALVTWLATPTPWVAESALIGELDLPLNLDQNRSNAFYHLLVEARHSARERARALPVLPS